MACGLPVVARDVPGVRDLMTDGKEGFVVAGEEQMVGALMRLAESAEMRRAMGEKARERSLGFTAADFIEKAEQFYNRVLTLEAGGASPSPTTRARTRNESP
jgi:glycosyltransferase involved in cell wall biosynthesis